jgi:RND family efflux transporter MFP subunit
VHEDGSVHDHSHDAEEHNHEGHDHEHSDDEIEFPAEQAALIDFKVEAVNASPFSEVIKATGQIVPAQGDEAVVSAPLSGIVSFAGAQLAVGTRVGNGQRMFYISTDKIATGDVALKAKAAYDRAKADYERASSLLADSIVSQREFDESQAAYLQAKADYDALATSQSGRGTGINAPISGYMTALQVRSGDFVEMGQPLAVVSQNRKLVLRADVSQRYFDRLKNIRGANFTVPYSNATYRLSEMNGRLLSVGTVASAGSPLIPVTFEFDNNGSIAQGTYVEVYLKGAPINDALVLPITAITEQQGLYYVYIQTGKETYQRRQVTLGANAGDTVVILSGLHAGERVVTRGAINVKLASASGAIPHGHEH